MSYKDSLAHWYDMSTPVGLPDLGKPGGNPGVGANIVSNPPGMPGGRCAEFNGDDSNYNLGDIVEVNAVSAFTIAFWMNPDVLDVADIIFRKYLNATHRVQLETAVDGNFYFENGDGANTYVFFDYSILMAAGTWCHTAWVFDGAQAVNADRHRVYLNGARVALTTTGAWPATTADLAARNASIGHSATSFDGKLDSFGIFTDPLTQLQVADHRLATMQGRL